MIQKNKQFFPLLLLVSIMLTGCSDDDSNLYKADVSDVKVDLDITRFESRIFEIERSRFPREIKKLNKEYPALMNLYVQNVVGLGRLEKDTTVKLLEKFIYDPYWRDVYKQVKKKYGNFDPVRKKLTQAFKHIRHYYPDDTLPHFYTLVKGIDLRYKVATYPPHKMAIFLDMYLGTNYKYYPSQYPDYRITEFQQIFIVPDVLEAYFDKKYPEGEYSKQTFLSKMLYRGKKLFFVKSMMPHLHDSTVLRYSAKQWNWCNKYESRIWNHFVENELLYQTNTNKFDKYLREGPFTNAGGIPPESPPRLGAFTGWKIIEEYMANKPDITLQQLMRKKDYKSILNQSGYNP